MTNKFAKAMFKMESEITIIKPLINQNKLSYTYSCVKIKQAAILSRAVGLQQKDIYSSIEIHDDRIIPEKAW